jgi:AhpD family alkylhydroperoxidase
VLRFVTAAGRARAVSHRRDLARLERWRSLIMKSRIDLNQPSLGGVLQAMFGLERQIRQSGLDEGLLNLIRMRASQINGCAYCLDMHSKDARAHGETEQRLYGLSAWRETPYYTERERAALEWTEALTLVGDTHVPDDVYERVRTQFGETELANLSLAVVSINGWNRLAIATRAVPGSYQPGQVKQLHAAAGVSR